MLLLQTQSCYLDTQEYKIKFFHNLYDLYYFFFFLFTCVSDGMCNYKAFIAYSSYFFWGGGGGGHLVKKHTWLNILYEIDN